jgi:hypothetical protein
MHEYFGLYPPHGEGNIETIAKEGESESSWIKVPE